MSVFRILPSCLMLAGVTLTGMACDRGGILPVSSMGTAPELTVTHLPAMVWTVPQGRFWDPTTQAEGGHAQPHNQTWLLHLVMASRHPRPLTITSVEITLTKASVPAWRVTWPRTYLARMEWIRGAFDMTAEYYLTRVLHGVEEAAGPDLPAHGTISWVRVPLAAPWFVDADAIVVELHVKDGTQTLVPVRHTIPVSRYRQRTLLRLPFEGTWAVNAGNDLSTGHRRSGLNGLTSYGWDFVKLGPDGRPFRTDGTSPEDFYTFGQPALAAADGTVVHARDDIAEFGVGEAPPADLLRRDGDAFAGNLVVLDHGNGEFSLTSHLLGGTVAVKVGDTLKAGDRLGLVGNSGFSGIPHIHFNLMDSGAWLQARGLPALFSDFERLRTGAPPERIPLGNPVSAWLVRMP